MLKGPHMRRVIQRYYNQVLRAEDVMATISIFRFLNGVDLLLFLSSSKNWSMLLFNENKIVISIYLHTKWSL